MMTWQTVKGRNGKRTGRMRQTKKGRWVVEGRSGSFATPLDAMAYLLRREEGMQYQIKTALSHEYWTGKGWSKDRNEGKLYKTQGKAENVAAELNLVKNSGSQSWNRVLAVEWVADNWGRN